MTDADAPGRGIAERILHRLLPAAEGHRIRRAQVGLVYSAVQLDSGAVGVAYTFPQSRVCHDGRDGESRPLAGERASLLLKGLGGRDLLASTLGLATANALLGDAPPAAGCQQGDILEILDLQDGDRVCLVGCFVPVLAGLQQRRISIVTVDEVPKPGARPASQAEELLPASQVAILTATSLINGTLAHLLDLARGCREVALLGPSTPLLPEAFGGTPLTCLAGIRASEPEALLQSIAEGHGFRVFKKHAAKMSLRTARRGNGRAPAPGNALAGTAKDS